MRRATELDLIKDKCLKDTENNDLRLYERYNAHTWLAIRPDKHLEVVSVVDINKYFVKE